MSPSADVSATLRSRGYSIQRAGVVRLATGTVAVGTLLLGIPTFALALPPGASAPVLEVVGPVVAFYAGTAEIDGSTTLEPTTTGTRSRLDCTILFGKDSDVLRPGAKERLRRLGDQLHAEGAGRVAVTGYTDDLGSAAHGLDLSERRARRVAHELGRVLPGKRFPMVVRGLGEAHPAVPNTSEANRRKNRRVVVTLTRTKTTSPPSRPAAPSPSPTPTPAPTAMVSTSATASPSPAATPTSASSTPAAAPPPPAPPSSAASPEPAPVPWAWLGGAGAVVVGVGALADVLRRLNRTPAPPGDAAGAVSDPGSAAGAGVAPTRALLPKIRQDSPSAKVPDVADAVNPVAAEATTSTPPVPGGAAVPEADQRPTPDAGTGQPAPESRLEAALAADLAAWQSADTYRPRLSVLGPVHARTRGKALARRRPYYTELFAYLALRPQGATVDDMAEDFSLTPARVRTDMKILRDWLGTDPRTGTAYLPDARTTPAALRRGVAVYQLDGALCDWHLFQRLRAATKPKGEGERAADLQAAFDLVTGRPFEHARPAGWGWLFEGDRVDLHAAKAVADVAVDLVGYHRAHQDDTAASRIVDTLAKIDPEKADEIMAGSKS